MAAYGRLPHPRRRPWGAQTFDLDDLLDRFMLLALRIGLLGWVPVTLCFLLFGEHSPATLIAALVWTGPAISVILGFGLWFVWLLISAPFER
jgi:hypothetical protein